MPINEELSDLTYQRLRSASFIPVFPRMYMTEDALDLSRKPNARKSDGRSVAARARPAPVYSYAAQQFHLVAFLGDMIVSVATFLREDQATSKRLEGSSWRLPAMATHPDFRNQGLASAVLEHGLRTLRRRDASLLWANGRSTGMGFYLRQGFCKRAKNGNRPAFNHTTELNAVSEQSALLKKIRPVSGNREYAQTDEIPIRLPKVRLAGKADSGTAKRPLTQRNRTALRFRRSALNIGSASNMDTPKNLAESAERGLEGLSMDNLPRSRCRLNNFAHNAPAHSARLRNSEKV